MKRISMMMVLLLCSSWMVQASGQDDVSWGQWRGPGQSGSVDAKGYFPDSFSLKLEWEKHLGSGYSGLSIVDGKLIATYAEDNQDWVGAFEVESGKPIWKFRLEKMYQAHDGGHDGPVSTPVADQDHVYALSATGRLVALRLNDGKLVWESHLVRQFKARVPFWGFTSTPAMTKDLLIVQAGGGGERGLIAFNKTDGKVRWQKSFGRVVYRSPVISELHGEQQLIACSNSETCGIRPSDGKKLWSFGFSSSTDMTPVPVGSDQFFLTGNSACELIRVDQSMRATSVWRTREFRGNYDTPVSCQGFLFGFSGDLLTCVDEKTGKRKWTTYQAAGKGLIEVDGKLVIFDARGHLVIVEARGDKYVEAARLKISNADGYAAPSFANGRIFLRNLRGDVFTLKPSTEPVVAASRPAADSAFAKAMQEIENADVPSVAASAWFAQQKSFPIVEDEKWVHFIYRGDVKDVAIQGSMKPSGPPDVLTRVKGTNLYYRSYPIESGSRWEYNFVVNIWSSKHDSLNPLRAYDDPAKSELVLKGWSEPDLAKPFEGTRGSRFQSIRYQGGRAQVLLPPGYDKSKRRYPTLILTEGSNWIRPGMLRDVLDHLYQDEENHVIIAFVTSHGSRALGGGGTIGFAKVLAEELVPALDKNFRTIESREAKTIAGRRGAAVAAVYTALRYPDVFGNCIAISYGRADTVRAVSIQELINQSKDQAKPKFHIGWNRYEVRKTQSFDCRLQSIALTKHLKEKNFSVQGGERNDSSSWRSWRVMFAEAFQKLSETDRKK